MKKLIIVLSAFVFLSASNSEEDFLKTLNEVSEIATKTKLNIDKTPSNVDVIRRDFIIKSGAKTLLDVLQYIPGIEIAISSSGKKELIIRGNKSTYRDKIKFMINGVDVTNSLYSNQFYYYNFPASLIKRIEFTKTPDSVLYGGTAFLGVINVITVNEYNDNFANFYVSDKNEYMGSFFNKFKNLDVDFYYSYSNPDVKSPPTYLIDLQQYRAYVYREPVSANELERNFGLGLKYKINDKDTLSYRLQFYQKGNFFGISRLTPLKKDKHVDMTHQYLNFNHSHFLNANIKNDINFGIKLYEWKGQYRTVPYDFNYTIDNNPDNDVIVGADVHEIDYYFKDQVTYENEKHNFVALVEAKYTKPYDYYYQQYVPGMGENQNIINLGPDGEHLTGEYNALKEGIYRKSISVALQDLYMFNDTFSVVAGSRLDSYSDFGSKLSYKFGIVKNFNERTTGKLIFNNAYRVPSFIELYAKSDSDFNGNPNLKPETINMLEAILIQKFTQNDKMKLVCYFGKNKNYIGRAYSLSSGKKIYENLGDYYIKGMEVSYDYVTDKTHFNVSYSLNDNSYSFSDIVADVNVYDWPGNRKHLIKSYFMYNITPKQNFFVSCLYGSKIAAPHYVDDIDDYFTVNTNYRYKIKNLEFSIGIDNLTDHKNYYWIDPSNIIFDRYLFEFKDAKVPAVGRKIFLDITKKW